MASIRKTLSPVVRPGTAVNGEACTISSPLSKSSSYNSNHLQPGSLPSSCFGSLEYALYRAQNSVFSIFSQRSSRPLERSKATRQSWRRARFHFLVCFFLGAFAGLSSFASSDSSLKLFSQHQAFSFEILKGVDRIQFYSMPRNATTIIDKLNVNDNATSGIHVMNDELKKGMPLYSLSNQSRDQNTNVSLHKLLIIVTPTYARPLQEFHLNRLAHTLKLVPPPLLWIVVEMTSQSVKIAEMLRNSGVMYRHLVCSKNLTDISNKGLHLLDIALAHIETHHLDGITYLAEDDNIYALELFEQMRQISRLGTWIMGKLVEPQYGILLDGPICNGSKIIGWHTSNATQKFCRFHAQLGGFAFNSTVLWDPKKWRRPTLESVRLLDTVKNGCYVSSFIEQIVEDESQMEGFPLKCSRIMVWHSNWMTSKIYALEDPVKDGSLQHGLTT